jgi:DNA polymerase III subunit epsilon
MISFFRKTGSEVCWRYLAETHRLPRKTPVKDIRIIVLDTETSGFLPSKDRILSIALFDVTGGQIDLGSSRKWIVFQPETGPTSATAIHGILPCETRAGVAEKTVLEELLPLLSGAILVGHHIRFDAAMLSNALLRHFKIRLHNQLIDTAILAMNELVPFHRSGYANQHPPSLDEVCAHLNLPVIARHTAEGDAFLTAEIFLMLCGKIRKRLAGRRIRRRGMELRDLPVCLPKK